MYSSSLLQHFKLIDPSQFDEFRRFVRSDYFNRGAFKEEIIVLLEVLIAAHPNMQDETLTKESVHERLFPEKEFLKNRIEKAMSELNVILKEFLLLNHYRREENAFQRNLDWTQLMRILDDSDRYELALERLKKGQENDAQASVDYYLKQYLIHKEEHAWRIANYNGKDDINLINTLDALIKYYAVQGLDHLNSLMMTAKVAKIDIPEHVIRHIMLASTDKDRTGMILLDAQYRTSQLLQKQAPLPEDFAGYMAFLKEHESALSPDVLKDFYSYIRNFCTLITNVGYDNLRPLLHEIQKESLIRGYFYYNNKIYPNIILAITRVAIYVNQLDWLKVFLENHRTRISGETEVEEYYFTNLALYYFATGDFDGCLNVLPDINFRLVNYQITIKVTEIKCYYELRSSLLPFKLEAFKVYLSRNTNKFFTKEQQEYCTKFTSVALQLMNCRKGDKKKVEKIKRKIREDGNFFEQVWLLKKLDEIT